LCLQDDTIEVLEIPGANSGLTQTAGGTEIRLVKRCQLPKNPSEVQLIPGGYAPRPKDKMERMDAAADQMLSGGHVSGEIVLQALADKLNRKTSNIRQIFRNFDEDKDGTVSYREFRHGLQMMGFEPTDEQYEELLRIVDSDGGGNIDYVEFYNTIKPIAEDDAGDAKGPTIGNTGVAQVPFVSWEDLRPGQMLDCFGKMVELYDADSFTKRFYHLHGQSLVSPQGNLTTVACDVSIP